MLRTDESHARPPLITFLILAATGSWIVVILTVLSFAQAFDAYWYLSIPRIVTTINTGQVVPGSTTPAWDVLVAQLSILLGLPLRILLFLPIGGLLLSIMAYAFMRRLKLPPVASALFVAYVATASLNATAYSIFAHAWAYPILFAIMLCLVGIAQGSPSKVSRAALLAILFIALHLVYYGGELLAMLYVLAFALFAGLSRFRGGRGARIQAPLNLSLALFVLFVVFNQMLYQAYVPSISQSSLGESFEWVSGQLGHLLQGISAHPRPYHLVSWGNTVIAWTSTAQILIIGAPILLFLIYPIYQYVKHRRVTLLTRALDSAIVLSLLFTSIGDFFVYSFLGLVILRTVYLLLPVAGALTLRGFGNRAPSSRRALPIVFLAVLFVLSAVAFPAQMASGQFSSRSTLAQIEPGAKWFLMVQQADYGATLTDLRTATRLTLIASETGGTFTFHSYDSLSYGAIVGAPGASLSGSGVRYVVVDEGSLNVPVFAYNWTFLEPLVTYYPIINNNPALDKVYDDSSMAVFVNAT